LPSGFPRPIDVKDNVVISLTIPQPSRMLLFDHRASEQIVQKHGSQGFDRGLIQRGEKATERRAGWKLVTPEECHERACPGLKPFVKRFERSFATHGIAKKHGNKIDQFVMSETAASKAHLFFKSRKDALTL
jgi:hypothetical protein